MHCKVHSSIAEIPAALWDGLFNSRNPFVQHAFLLAMEESGCVSARTGWQPRHMVLHDGGEAVAVLPLYEKNDSYGEFVFDWGWAEAYQRHGLNYYPKLVTAIPFSPVAGPRVGIAESAEPGAVFRALLDAIHQLSAEYGYSGWHLLFPGERLQKALIEMRDEGAFMHREAVQFHWFNREYQSFDDFLATLRSSRRKNIRRERRRVAEEGVTVMRKAGAEISDEDWRGFYQCYQSTYLKRSGHTGYLNWDFFSRLRETMSGALMLVVAYRNDGIVASSLFLYDRDRLYGRYWGALRNISCLHFEACFYQGIEFCIENGIQTFDPGTQGEHKLVRGFEPVKSASYHWIANPQFRRAIADFLNREKRFTEEYKEQAEDMLPYRKADV
jgi:predicted N-acyltransferase